jgi:xanthine dehydrogenase YagS FAD-binding subunit
VKTTTRTISIDDFFGVDVRRTSILGPDEIITEFILPTPAPGTKSAFLKFALRKSIDFPIVNCAAALTFSGGTVTAARICLNAVYVKPYRVPAAEEAVVGKALSEEIAGAAADAAMAGAKPLTRNKYLIQIAKTLVKRTLLACG